MNPLNRNDLPLIWIRGAGDLATGVGIRLLNAGFRVIYSEIEQPTVIRRTVAFASAVYEGITEVESYVAVGCDTCEMAAESLAKGQVPVFTGEESVGLTYLSPDIFIEATIRKYHSEIPRNAVRYTIALGPGYSAPIDVDAVIETMRGHYLGRVIWTGSAIPNTGVPGEVGGFSKERVIHAPAEGKIIGLKAIGDLVTAGETIALIRVPETNTEIVVPASITGTLRGLINNGLWVEKGFKIADIDPRCDKDHCFTVSDKARAIGGGVLEAVMYLSLKSE